MSKYSVVNMCDLNMEQLVVSRIFDGELLIATTPVDLMLELLQYCMHVWRANCSIYNAIHAYATVRICKILRYSQLPITKSHFSSLRRIDAAHHLNLAYPLDLCNNQSLKYKLQIIGRFDISVVTSCIWCAWYWQQSECSVQQIAQYKTELECWTELGSSIVYGVLVERKGQNSVPLFVVCTLYVCIGITLAIKPSDLRLCLCLSFSRGLQLLLLMPKKAFECWKAFSGPIFMRMRVSPSSTFECVPSTA